MKTRAMFDSSMRARGGAFTLIELLVVITIIAALAALSASAVMKFIEVQQNNNTQSTLDRTQSKLGLVWSKVKDQANKESIPAGVLALAGNDANAVGRARVIYVKLKWRQAFPMSFDEALNLPTANTNNQQSPLGALPAYVTYLSSLGINGSLSTPPAQYESSACLLMALQRGVGGAGINPEELTKGGGTGAGFGGIPYLTDAWNRPIYFSRFPTGCPVLNPNSAQPGANDPGDPQGYLNSGAWPAGLRNTFSAIALQQLAAPPTPPSNVALSYKLAPMVASGGAFNWMKTGTPPFDPNTFTPTGSTVMFSNP